MGLSAYFIPYLIMMFFYGIALTVVQTSITTLIQEHTDVSMQGRVFGLLGTMYSGFLPLGMAALGQRNWKAILGVTVGLELFVWFLFVVQLQLRMP